MSPGREAKIRDLAAEQERARVVYENYKVMQTPADFVDRVKALQELALSEARFLDAHAALTAALTAAINETEPPI